MKIVKELLYGSNAGGNGKHLVRTIKYEPAPISVKAETVLTIICEEQPSMVIINGIEYFKKEDLDV